MRFARDLHAAGGVVTMPPFGLHAILSCETSLVDFLAENRLLVGGDREEDHRAQNFGLTASASFIDRPH